MFLGVFHVLLVLSAFISEAYGFFSNCGYYSLIDSIVKNNHNTAFFIRFDFYLIFNYISHEI